MSTRYLQELAVSDVDGERRQQALTAFYAVEAQPTSLVEYQSAGSVLLVCPFRSVGDEETALSLAAALPEALDVTLLITGVAAGDDFELRELAAARGVRLESAETVRLAGYLGRFEVSTQQGGRDTDLARRLLDRPGFDLVLDASAQALLAQELPPPGYFHVGDDPAQRQAAIEALPDMIGSFEKPRFVVHDPDICAHSRSGKIGCSRCLDVCPTGALSHQEETIAVDVHLCQGAGPCATVCPSGAISYQYPPARDLLNGLRQALSAYPDAQPPVVLLHDSEQGEDLVSELAADLPTHLLPLQVAETGTVGAEFWLAALAWGAGGVCHLVPEATPPSVRAALESEIHWVQALLRGLGLPADLVRLVQAAEVATLPPAPRRFKPARHMSFAGKRNNLGLAIDHLVEVTESAGVVDLPRPAPFGEVRVDRDKCTLCMACVSACPAGALLSGDDSPRLRFVESNCLQCGLCRETCPESAVSLASRWQPDPVRRREVRILHEDEPLKCVSCGKPFGNKRMVETLQQRLGSHWMYQNPAALRRLQMCENCRVVDMYARDGGMDVYNKS